MVTIVAHSDAYVASASAARFVDYLRPIRKFCGDPMGIAIDAELGVCVQILEGCYVFGQGLKVRNVEQTFACLT